MYRRYYLVYAAGAPQSVTASPLPERTAYRLCERTRARCWVGDMPLPHWLAADLAKQSKSVLEEMPSRKDLRRPLQEVIGRRLRRWGWPARFSWEEIEPAVPLPRVDYEAVLQLMSGRILFASEAAAMASGLAQPDEMEEYLAELAVDGEIDAMPAVEVMHFGRAVCRRCGETRLEREDCWYCGQAHCWTCPACSAYGSVTGCRTLYARASSASGHRHVPAARIASKAELPLSPAQSRAAEKLKTYVTTGESGAFLLWAVCGAGKTEVALAGLAEALSRGSTVLLATPRRDVAAQLAERMEAAFPGLPMAVHYGGRHEDRIANPALVVATTHQCLRFYQAFDLVILDEVDAFPYHGNRLLYTAVQRARKPGGRAVYLTATPPADMEAGMRRGSMPGVRIPVRYHGHPLPVPQLMSMALGRRGQGWRPPPAIATWLGEIRQNGHPALVFVPTVETARLVGAVLTLWGKEHGLRAAYVYAEDEGRDGKLADFVQGRLEILVCTTLLERGLTMGALDVCVLYADREDIFDWSSLVQIAGRAGRLERDPKGRVLFAGEKIGPAMIRAREEIADMNEEAAREGFLKG